MVDGFYANNNRIQVIKSDEITFDSERPSIQLLPESSKLTISHTVTFPTLLAGIAYLQRTYSVGGTDGPYCESWSALIPQEWGPDEVDFSPTNLEGDVATRNLPETLIGAVPTGTDYIDVRARITRTQTPPAFLQQTPPPVMFKEGEWISLPGGSCPCEYFVPLARHFDIVLRGTALYLRRFQSVRNSGAHFIWGSNSGASPSNVSNSYGWFTNSAVASGNAPYNGAKVTLGTPATLIQSLGGNNSVNRRAPWAFNSTGACSITHPNYSSVYNCEFEIHPGRFKDSL